MSQLESSCQGIAHPPSTTLLEHDIAPAFYSTNSVFERLIDSYGTPAEPSHSKHTSGSTAATGMGPCRVQERQKRNPASSFLTSSVIATPCFCLGKTSCMNWQRVCHPHPTISGSADLEPAIKNQGQNVGRMLQPLGRVNHQKSIASCCRARH